MACEEIVKSGINDFVIFIVGENMDSLKALANEKKINDYFIFKNKIINNFNENKIPQFPSEKLIEIYKMSDVFVFPSLMETFGIVIIDVLQLIIFPKIFGSLYIS